ncbi:hypothetical protein ABAC460_22985 [Asticcacaulis sp. AC460]|uniref:beta strand repeat-containing protein n=1 Tax=Asticcacaulis sp. AC460 TaxID=1282360 RepID=UPI0003C3EBE0|nr:calcium-binding protein [Asticcacaulis sp. AC460]ESQ86581.1 hypothetical protein ABAC460_22985 [Asticcacaulis sp. AC460]
MYYVGTSGDDTFAGGLDNDTAGGAGGNDTLSGGSGNDFLQGNDGDDDVTGGWGNDTLLGGAGFDVLAGETGDDLLQDASGGSRQDGWTGNDTLRGGTGADTLDGGDQDDSLHGGDGDDVLWDGAVINPLSASGFGNDVLRGGAGDDVIFSLAGSDTIDGGDGVDSLYLDLDRWYHEANYRIDMSLAATAAGTDIAGGILLQNLEVIEVHFGLGDDSFYGGAFDDRFYGGYGNDVADGGNGADVLEGQDGNDWLSGGAGNDTVRGGNGNDTISYHNAAGAVEVHLAIATAQATGGAGTDLILDVENVTGSAFGDRLFGTAGGNVLDGGAGADTLRGADGDDTYIVDDSADRVFEFGNEGIDTIRSSVTYSLSGQPIEKLVLTGGANINATGNGLHNIITGNDGNNVIDGAAGNDIMYGGGGDDTFYVQAAGDIVEEDHHQGNDTIYSTISYSLVGRAVETLILTGSANSQAIGNSLANLLTGNSGHNRLDGGKGLDTMAGGAGNDTYVVNAAGDMIVEGVAEGQDRVLSTVTYSLTGWNVEDLELIGTRVIDGTGNEANNQIWGNSAANRLDGGSGNDILAGGLGDDTYVIDSAGDVVVEALNAGNDLVVSSVSYSLGINIEHLTLTGTGNVNGTGNAYSNILTGNAGINILTGGAGNDVYIVQNAEDVVMESNGEGADTVISYIDYTVGADNVEYFSLGGSADLSITGSASNDYLKGNTGNNVLNGLGGGDSMFGGAGNDIYYVDNLSDQVRELPGEGYDTIRTAIGLTMPNTFVEALDLLGTANIYGTGTILSNSITGNSGANVINGLDGSDTLAGGDGADTLDGGRDGDHLTGGLGADSLYGGQGSDVLDGGVGADTMAGGTSGDVYFIDNSGDVIIEGEWAGADVVVASSSYTLGAWLESVILTGTGNFNATGNSRNNALTGNDGINVLDGGAGNDTYVIQNAGDTVTDSQGVDRIYSTVSYALGGTGAEELQLTGTADINATGTSGNDLLIGNSGINQLVGGGGNDSYYVQNAEDVVIDSPGGSDVIFSTVSYTLAGTTVRQLQLTGAQAVSATGNADGNVLVGNNASNVLNGGTGNDFYTGLDGADIFLFEAGSGVDVIADFSEAANDSINIHAYTGGAVLTSIVTQAGANVLIDLGGGNSIQVSSANLANVLAHIVW